MSPVTSWRCDSRWASAQHIVGPPRACASVSTFPFPLQREQHVSAGINWSRQLDFSGSIVEGQVLSGEHEALYKLPSKATPHPSVSFKGTVYRCIWQTLFGVINPLRIWTFMGQQMGQPALQFNKVIYFNHRDRAGEDYWFSSPAKAASATSPPNCAAIMEMHTCSIGFGAVFISISASFSS